jgi:hypothetical protein
LQLMLLISFSNFLFLFFLLSFFTPSTLTRSSKVTRPDLHIWLLLGLEWLMAYIILTNPGL